MNIRFFCPRWGSEYLDWDTFLKKVLDAGYHGVEYSVSAGVTEKELEMVYNSLQKNKCAVILQHYDTYSPDFDAHCKAYDSWFNKIAPFKALKINSQTGKDFFSFEQNKTLIGIASGHAEKFQTEISHETHRNKFNFAAHITSRFLEAIPTLRLTLDVSHWVNVAESYLDDQPAAVALAVSRTDHIHARVGYTQGPQVPDPRVAEWQEAVDKHLTIWDAVMDYKRNHGHSLLTICPEFGPAPYMVHIPSTNQPIANQWEVNEHMLNLLKKRYL